MSRSPNVDFSISHNSPTTDEICSDTLNPTPSPPPPRISGKKIKRVEVVGDLERTQRKGIFKSIATVYLLKLLNKMYPQKKVIKIQN